MYTNHTLLHFYVTTAHDVYVSHTHLSLVRYSEGTLDIGRQVFESSYQESDAKQLLQKSRWELSLQLLIGV